MISCHLFVGINLLVLMLCGIFLIRVVMLWSSWLTEMVIKTSIERQVIPNQTLTGFDKIDSIKEELEKACPGVVSCADIVSIATRDGIMLVCS